MFNTAEIDSWFYKIPTKIEAKSYSNNTPDDFYFTCKAFQDITLTHKRNWNKDTSSVENHNFLSIDLFNEYCESIEPLLHKIELIMFEFEYLNKEKMESVDKFIDLFSSFKEKIDKNIKIGIETRNKNFLTEKYFNFLKENNIVHVFSEKQYMPHIYEVYAKYKDYIGDTTVFRLLGNDRAEIEKATSQNWNKIVDEKKDKEDIIKVSIDTKFDRGKVIINVNNHYEGSAPLTIEVIRKFYQRYGILI